MEQNNSLEKKTLKELIQSVQANKLRRDVELKEAYLALKKVFENMADTRGSTDEQEATP
ncbi:MAG: hypothetical protein NTY48_04525 [Candidatus Diapherotrites archaeon]|nr:hypothetical protein [Candidatus Diapherotrites archaeon]